MPLKVSMFGKEYNVVISGVKVNKKDLERRKTNWEAPKPKDLHKEMTKQRVSHHYILALLNKLANNFGSQGAELVRSDGDVYVSILKEGYEVLIAPIFGEDEATLVVERIMNSGALKMFGTVAINEETNYNEILNSIRQYTKRAVSI